jgi:hypothetical protein
MIPVPITPTEDRWGIMVGLDGEVLLVQPGSGYNPAPMVHRVGI